jgi:hypothetical protein
MSRSLQIFDRKCSFDDELIRVPMDGMAVNLDHSKAAVAFKADSGGEEFVGEIGRPDNGGINGWALAFVSTFLGNPFDPAISIGRIYSILSGLNGASLGMTAGREGFSLLVTPGGRVHGVIGQNYSRVPKRWLHSLAVSSAASAMHGPVTATEATGSYGRVCVEYSAAGRKLFSILYGEETGCSAYHLSWGFLDGCWTSCMQWRHKQPLSLLEQAVCEAAVKGAARTVSAVEQVLGCQAGLDSYSGAERRAYNNTGCKAIPSKLHAGANALSRAWRIRTENTSQIRQNMLLRYLSP